MEPFTAERKGFARSQQFTADTQESIGYEGELAGLRAGIDEKTFNLLWEDGRSMNIEQAIELALEE